ncbi:MAG: 2-oxoglutarate dehydrogenase complex dihydrolipoyllysine-residue succinyltransferase [Candidatus Cyclobacteriaceae bacterium M3_2C_046]
MSVEVKVPSVGESVTEVTISQWLKNEGDYVNMDEVLCELESDKATFELNAENSGILHIRVQEGETLEVGSAIAEIDTEASAPAQSEKKQEVDEEEFAGTEAGDTSKMDKTGQVVEMKVPTVGESITEVTIASWFKNSGDFVELDEVIAEIESDKATFELTAEAKGILEIIANEGETLEVGALICKIEVVVGTIPEKQAPSRQKEPADQNKSSLKTYASGHPSPAAAKILSEKGMKPEEVNGTGVDGRITKEDAMKARPSSVKPESPEKEKPAAEPTTSGDRNQRRQKLTTLRKTIAKRLVSVKNEMAMLTTFNEVDMQPVIEIRSKYKEMFKEKYEVNLGFMSFFVKACTVALKEWPAVNALIDGEEMVYHDYCDISIAVSTPKGLVVPVIRNAEKMSFDQVEKEIIRLATRAREGKISIDEMTGGTFTITNGGVFGSMLSTPIINAPQAAILGMHNIVERPVAVNGEIKIRPIMYVALSYDHRIIDGRESVSFLVRLKQLLEDPARLLLGI